MAKYSSELSQMSDEGVIAYFAVCINEEKYISIAMWERINRILSQPSAGEILSRVFWDDEPFSS